MIVRVFVTTDQLIPLAEFSRDVRAVFDTTGFSSNPTVLVSRRRWGRVQS